MAKRDITFDLINGNVVSRLSREGRIELPHRQLDIPKDERWNEKQMSAKILQGILNGDSIPTIAKSMEEVVGRNEVSAMRNTRTMVTSAQNQGRLDSYNNLAAQGVVMKKEWEATPDDRTRKSHIDIDGEEQDLDKPFSNKCMFPGDGNGPGEEVWNCRCAMGSHIIGFRRRDGSISRVNYTPDRTSHEDQMEKYKERLRSEKEKSTQITRSIVNGNDISNTWTRRADKFDFVIEDVINAQGFDGLPRLVDEEEFNKCVQEANDGNGLIAMRGYSAPDKDSLLEYQNQLYNGKWYVDCSEGGHAYGRGMYGAYNYGYEAIEAVKGQAGLYGNTTNGIIETFTLDPSAKIISSRESSRLLDKMQDFVDEKGNKPYKDFDEGSISALFGYDAIVTGRGAGEIIVLNRTKIIFKR